MTNAFLATQVRALGGVFSEWPEQRGFEEAVVARWLEQSLPESVGTLDFLSCDEFPCVAVVRFAEGLPASSEVLQPVASRFAAELGVAQPSLTIVGRGDDAFGLMALGPALGDGTPATQRLPTRIQELVEVVVDAGAER